MGSHAEYTEVDVVIIGAGLAGLTAATHIVNAGYSCRVLEARDRVGGRTWSQTQPSGGIIDVGAAWINDTNQSRMIELAKQFDLTLITQNTDGDVLLQYDGGLKRFAYGEVPSFPDGITEHLIHIRDTVEADCQELSVTSTMSPRHIELDAMTFSEYLKKLGANQEATATAAIWTRAMLGQDPKDISALFFLLYCKAGGGLMQMRSDRVGGGQYLRLREGTQAFAINLAKPLSDVIEYDSPVLKIANGRVGRYQARKIICAAPLPVVSRMEFVPELPEAKRKLLESYKYGYYQKVMVVFKCAFWTREGLCGLLQSFSGPSAVVRDTSSAADGDFVLTCFVAGSPGMEWSKKPEVERQEAVLRQLEDILGSDVRHEYIRMVGHQWNDDEWNGYGCPSPALGPGVLSSVGHELFQPAGDIYFAGTESSDVWRGYMEGAVRSGETQAKLVIEALKSSNMK